MRGEPLAEPPRVDRGLLLHGVRLEPVAGRLVEQHAAEAVADHDRHRPGGAGRASSIVSARRAASSATAAGSPSKSSKPACPASDSDAGLDAVAAARDDLRAEPHAACGRRRVSSPSEFATCTSRRCSL